MLPLVMVAAVAGVAVVVAVAVPQLPYTMSRAYITIVIHVSGDRHRAPSDFARAKVVRIVSAV